MAFLISVVIVQCIALFVMYSTNAYMLARIHQIERQLLSTRPPDLLARLQITDHTMDSLDIPQTGTAVVHVVDPDCSGCLAHVASIPSAKEYGESSHIVVATALAAADIEPPEGVPVHVLPELVDLVRPFGPLPQRILLVDRKVVGHEGSAELRDRDQEAPHRVERATQDDPT